MCFGPDGICFSDLISPEHMQQTPHDQPAHPSNLAHHNRDVDATVTRVHPALDTTVTRVVAEAGGHETSHHETTEDLFTSCMQAQSLYNEF